MKSVKFRLNADSNIGLGHLIRCLSIAKILKNEFHCSFYINKSDIDVSKILNEFKTHVIKSENNFISTLIDGEILVLDGYSFQEEHKKMMKSKGVYLVCLDDLYQNQNYADMIINHAPSLDPKKYPIDTKLLLGPEYALLRPEFINEFDNIYNTPPKKIFICFGGSDTKNLTQHILNLIINLYKSLEINVVVGPGYRFYDKLISMLNHSHNSTINIKNSLSEIQIIDEMNKNDLLIVPSSSILFEAISLYKPIISGFYVDNQKLIYEGFKKAQVFYDAKDFSTLNFLSSLKEITVNNSKKMIENQRRCIDKKSPSRILNAFKMI